MEHHSSQLCAFIDSNSFFAKKSVVSYFDKKIVIELSERTLIVPLIDIASIKIIRVTFFGGRIFCIKTVSGNVVTLRISDYHSFKKFIQINKTNLTIQSEKNPAWIALLYLTWILLAVSYVPIMSSFSSNNGTITAGILAYGSLYLISAPILLILSFVIMRVVPVTLEKKWLLYLWLIPVFGFGIIVLNLMDKYSSFKNKG